ncbi:MAG: DinB family protein [Candidatus Promineifilaceae bacterium]
MGSQFRKQFLVQMHLTRAELLHAMIGMSAEQLEQAIWDDYSTRRLLPHIARWEAFEADQLRLMIDGKLDQISATSVDEMNAAWHRNSAEITIDGGIAMLQKERNGLLNVIANAPDQLLKSTIKIGERENTVMQAITNSVDHDDDHARDIQAWRKANDAETITEGPRSILVAYLRATRNALRAVFDLIEGSDITIDEWTPKDILAHIAGWEPLVLRSLQENHAHDIADIDPINHRLTGEAADKSFDEVWEAYANGRKAVINFVERMSAAELAQPFESADSWHNSPYKWVRIFPQHDIDHARELYTAWLMKTRVKKARK